MAIVAAVTPQVLMRYMESLEDGTNVKSPQMSERNQKKINVLITSISTSIYEAALKRFEEMSSVNSNPSSIAIVK